MRYLTLLLLLISQSIFAQLAFLEGTWQGVLIEQNQSPKNGTAIWMEMKIDKDSGEMTGECRMETPFTNYYAYKSMFGKTTSRNDLTFQDVLIGSQKNVGANVWCLNKGELKYNDTTGYLEGTWSSTDCKRLSGQLILFRSRDNMSKTDTVSKYHSWFNNLVADLSRGWNAYYVRNAEMRSFEFVPVYFAHDKDELRTDFESYLKKMADIVNSHTDLRIKIIGHTDSNGPDKYNIDLSSRRAAVIRAFLEKSGVKPDKIIIEFRGENDPAKSNDTSVGKSFNRRVDFEFI
ncbi:OmpA family protein [Crocinitomix catalasitica]|uniref:OmpA family protein n=1 Tax=Crocinitomix catalasitica TaxID=184607 RepID=UPI000683FD9A|nr:OmpA family protein [Crocinitomix catalasitica]